jgi:hypothetical protein
MLSLVIQEEVLIRKFIQHQVDLEVEFLQLAAAQDPVPLLLLIQKLLVVLVVVRIPMMVIILLDQL